MHRTLNIVAFVAVFGLLIGCGGSDDKISRVRVFHASPDAPAVDILIDNSSVLNNVPFPVNSDYLDVDAGDRNVKVAVAGTDSVVINADLKLEKDKFYSILAVNNVANIEPLVLVDQVHTPNDEGCAVRVIHGAPSAPNVDVYATALNADLNNIDPVLSSVPFKAASGYLNVPCGNYQFRVTVAGTKTVAIDSGEVSIEQGAYTALAIDNAGGGAPFNLKLVADRR